MGKIVVGVWIFFVSLVALIVTAAMLASVLAAYPPTQIESFGPVVPAVSRFWAQWLPSAPTALLVAAAVSAALGLYLWRSRRPAEVRLFAAAVISAVSIFLALFCTMGLVVAYFYLPKVANGA